LESQTRLIGKLVTVWKKKDRGQQFSFFKKTISIFLEDTIIFIVFLNFLVIKIFRSNLPADTLISSDFRGYVFRLTA